MNNAYSDVIKYNQNQATRMLREQLRLKYGKGLYRLRANGYCSAYGIMPNTDKLGWHFIGWREDVAQAMLGVGGVV